jgi:hypothetical protein
MKKIISTIAISFIGAMLFGSCNDASKKDMTDATQDLKVANKDIKDAVIANNDTAKATAAANWATFKNESDSGIAVMEIQVTTLEAKIAKANTTSKEKMKNDLAKTREDLRTLKEKLAQKNTAFDNDIKKFDGTVVAKNESFEREFKHDMNGLGTAIKDLFKDNVK